MPKRLVLTAVLAFLPTLALAQGAAPNAPICDGSELRRAEHARDLGGALFIGTAAADVVAMVTIPHNPGGVSQAPSHFRFVALTAPVGLVGLLIAQRAHPGEDFWQGVIQRLTVGRTSTADVRLCLHSPDVTSVNTTGQRWTYVMARPSSPGGSLRTLRLTFRDSLLADVERTEVKHVADARTPDWIIGRPDRRHGFCAPPVPAIADAFPTPMDTTAAAAAMARAQADAEAASKNAANAAAYASCMASDSAQ